MKKNKRNRHKTIKKDHNSHLGGLRCEFAPLHLCGALFAPGVVPLGTLLKDHPSPPMFVWTGRLGALKVAEALKGSRPNSTKATDMTILPVEVS